MKSGEIWQILILILLLALSAFFSSAETAFASCNRHRLRTLAEDGKKRAALVLKILDQQQKMLSTILVGNNLVNISASALTTAFIATKFGNAWIGLATGILTFLVLLFGEIVPKSAATFHGDSMVLSYAPYVYGLMVLFTPIIWFIDLFSQGILRLFHLKADETEAAITEDEFRTILDVSHEEGVLETEEKEMINNVVDFGDSLAKDVMIPRIDMTCVDVNSTYKDLLELFQTEMYTRLPVYEESKDQIIGILNIKDVFRLGGPIPNFQIKDYMRDPFFTYEFKKTSELLGQMRKDSVSLAIVLDEYGITAGMITLEDLIEEIIGEIRDEYDDDEKNPIQKIDERHYLVEGSVHLDDLVDAIDIHPDFQEEMDTLAAFLIEKLEHLPKEGESVLWDKVRYTVKKVEKNRIDLVEIELPLPAPTPDDTYSDLDEGRA